MMEYVFILTVKDVLPWDSTDGQFPNKATVMIHIAYMYLIIPPGRNVYLHLVFSLKFLVYIDLRLFHDSQ